MTKSISFKDAIATYVDYAQQFDLDAPNQNWYVGRSIDPERRKRQHERDKGITCKYFAYPDFYFRTKEDAGKLEKALEAKGFAITEAELELKEATMEGRSFSKKKKLPEKHYVYIFLAKKRR